MEQQIVDRSAEHRTDGISVQVKATDEEAEPGFRFRGARVGRAPDVFRMDEALDQVGAVLHGDAWRSGPAFRLLPLFWRDREHTQLVTVTCCAGRRAEIIPAEVAPDQWSAAISAMKKFAKTYKKLRGAIQSGNARAYAVDGSGRRKVLKETDALYMRRRSAFGAGVIRLDAERHLIWIDRQTFKEWLEALAEDLTPSERKGLSNKHAEAFAKILTTYSERTGFKFDQPQLKALVDGVRHPARITQAEVTKQLWAILPDSARRLRGGAPSTQRFNEAQRELIPLLRSAYQESGN